MSQVVLPIYAHTEAILDAVRRHRVVVVEGAPGTGKTTQLPRLLCRAGLVQRCMGVTQPRRIAAVSVAWRIAAEEEVPIGDRVGYAIRFDDATGPRTQIKVMTDGILLQEARTDPLLRAYDCIMVDEAHERSLNIDFVLGLLHQVLARRDDLKVIISSATLYPGTFQAFFADVAGSVPVVRIDARTYPLTIEHRPVGSGHPDKVLAAACEAVTSLHQQEGPGHILVFLPGEGLIQKLEAALRQAGVEPSAIILPLFGRLTRAEQERIFDEFNGRRKIILATNLAETSITIDQVRFVVDTGFAKLPWFNARTGVTTLREMPISQASATQRAGRAGRTGPGRVIRLYDAKSFAERPEYTPEEIARVDLSEAVLRLIDLGVRDLESFPFPTPPPAGKLRAAITTLTELGAIDRQRSLTQVGRQMVPFPLSPALARMVVEAAMRFPDAVHDVLTVGAYLSVRSPFLYPPGEESAAKQAQRRLVDPRGDIMTAVNAVARWRAADDRLAFCKAHYLDADTMAFIERAHAQLCDIAHSGGVTVVPGTAAPDHVIRCVAAGFADKVLLRLGNLYETPTGVRCAIHPGSTTFSQPHRLLVAAELFHSGRTYAVNVSPIKPEWLVEFHPEAAKRWRIGGKRGKRGSSTGPSAPASTPTAAAAAAVPSGPSHLEIGAVRLPVSYRRHRPSVTLDLELVAQLRAQPPAPLPLACARWRAEICSAEGTWLRGPLPQVLQRLRWMPWPQSAPRLPRGLHLGSLLEADRNLHALERFAAALLTAMAGPGTPQPGWLALVGNGSGGYWFDVVPDFAEAVALTAEALEALEEALQGPLSGDLGALRGRCGDYVRSLAQSAAVGSGRGM